MAKKPASDSKKAPAGGRPSALVDTRVIYCGDNLDQLRKFSDECIDLIYIDPPFNSNRNYEVFWGETKEKRAFEDRHASTEAYIDFMRSRCVELHRVLKKTGSFYYHCDWHASHYVKIMLDQIFGENQFQNEIVWKRTTSHSDAMRCGNVHDVLFFYSKGDKYTWNKIYQAYNQEYIQTYYRYKDPDGREFMSDNLTGAGGGPARVFGEKGAIAPAAGRHWMFDQEGIDDLLKRNKIFWTRNGVPRLKTYKDEALGMPLNDVWDDIQALRSWHDEKLGYPTQKPLALLERIIKASSNENDIVLDAFCGCGTALVAAENLGRQWIGIDISPTACRVMAKRLRDVCGMKEDEKLWRIGRGFVVRDLPWSEEQLRKIPPFEFENWAVIALGGIPNKAQVGDMGIDGRIYPVSATPKKKRGELDFMDVWYPIQVKQKDKVGRPDIDAFEAVMMREDRTKGFFVSFDFSSDAISEIQSFFKKTGKSIIALTVKDILDEQIAYKLA
jgi:DNA modification methylase